MSDSEQAEEPLKEPLEFEWPADFEDEVKVEAKILPPPSPFKASAILYAVSSICMFLGVIIPLPDIIDRYHTVPTDTFIELLEWNPFSQLGACSIAWGLFIFWLGVLIDRRGV